MKISLRLIVVLFLNIMAQYIIAQDIKPEQRFTAADKAYSVLRDYISTMDFKENAISKGYDDLQITKFKSLFSADAKVLDEINHSTDMCHVDSPSILSIDDYLNKLRQNFPAGISSRLLKSEIKLDDLSNKKALLYLEKSVKGQYQNNYNYEVKDTIILTLTFGGDYNECKITSIGKAGGNFKCSNCTPCAGKHPAVVAQNKPVDKQIDKPDQPTKPKTKPEGDISVNLGAPFATILNPKPDVGLLKLDGGLISHQLTGFTVKSLPLNFTGSLEFDLYFTKNVGLSTGIYYSYTMMKTGYDSLGLTYNTTNNSITNRPKEFERLYSALGGTENLTSTNLGIPLILKTKFKIGEKMDFFFHLGGLVTFHNTETSEYNAIVDQEAIYGMNGLPDGSSHDIKLTRAFASKYGTNLNAYFNENKSFDVAINQPIKYKKNFTYNIGYGGLLRFGLSCKVSKVVAINIGANVAALSLSGNSQSTTTQPDALGKYYSIFSAVNQTTSISYFLNLGLQFKL